MPTPRRNSKPVQFYARPDLYEKVHAAGLSVSEFMENLVAEALAGEDFGDDPRKVTERVSVVEQRAADLARAARCVCGTDHRPHCAHACGHRGGALSGEDAAVPAPAEAATEDVPTRTPAPGDESPKPKRARRRTG